MGKSIAVFAIILAIIGTAPAASTSDGTADQPSFLTGEQAPAFDLHGPTGKVLHSSSFRGHPLVINFWATWCVACVEEMPLLEHVYRKHRSHGLAVVGFVVDDVAPDQLQSILRRTGITYPVFATNEKTSEEYGADPGLPLTVFIDPQGIVRICHRGTLDAKSIQRCLHTILK